MLEWTITNSTRVMYVIKRPRVNPSSKCILHPCEETSKWIVIVDRMSTCDLWSQDGTVDKTSFTAELPLTVSSKTHDFSESFPNSELHSDVFSMKHYTNPAGTSVNLLEMIVIPFPKASHHVNSNDIIITTSPSKRGAVKRRNKWCNWGRDHGQTFYEGSNRGANSHFSAFFLRLLWFWSGKRGDDDDGPPSLETKDVTDPPDLE